jgi:DNA-binding NtrC family response regulator
MTGDVTTIHGLPLAARAGGERMYLLVIGDDLTHTVPLPLSGEVSIGRSSECDVRIDHPSISRRHALLRLGPEPAISDLGSANGVRVRDAIIERHRPEPLAYGEVALLGAITILVQRRSAPPRPARVRTLAYFEGRLEDECERGASVGRRFAVARIHAGPARDRSAVDEVLRGAFRPGDVIALYAPDEVVALLFDVDAEGAAGLTAAAAARLAPLCGEVRVGTALFPRDGRSPDALLAAAARPLQHLPATEHVGEDVIVRSPAVVQLYRTLVQVAAGRISVLLLGETGAGKEVVARALHRSSPRREGPFVRLNCAALSPTLLESELFGHEKGAFTGAMRAKPGLLETAVGGTVFLDEVGELPLDTQVKLLRVIEEREVLRVGGLQPRSIDVRFVAATNRDLDAAVARGAFREDLYFRLAGVTLVIPPLRDRPEELSPLAEAFVCEAAREIGVRAPALSEPALALMRQYGWPGNVRELRNVMERAVLLCGGGVVEPAHLPLDKMRVGAITAPAVAPAPPSGADAERERIVAALARCGGSQTRAAELLGISRRTLTKRLTRYDLPRPRKDGARSRE